MHSISKKHGTVAHLFNKSSKVELFANAECTDYFEETVQTEDADINRKTVCERFSDIPLIFTPRISPPPPVSDFFFFIYIELRNGGARMF